jgi:hypothetical protein
MCLGGALGSRYGLFGTLGGAVSAGIIGYTAAVYFEFLCAIIGEYEKRLTQSRPVLGRVFGKTIAILTLAAFGSFLFATIPMITRPLKANIQKSIRAHRYNTNQPPRR